MGIQGARERERERERETERQRDRERQTDRQTETETDRQADSKCKERLTTIFYAYQNGETIVFSCIRTISHFSDPARLHTDHINMH